MPIDLDKFCCDKEIEICAVKLHYSRFNISNIYILTLYRSPTGNFLGFLNAIESVINKIYTNSINIILCADININYLDDVRINKHKLNSLLATYNLHSIVDFPTRVTNTSAMAIDSFFN
jgi:hypothetical protein